MYYLTSRSRYIKYFESGGKNMSWGDEVPKEGVHHTCFCYEKNYPQVYLKENKYRVKKIKKNAWI